MLETSSRLLDLLALLQARRFWPGGELADRLEVGARTLRRDVERLRRLGYPVEAQRGPAGGYRLAAGTAMPPLLLDDEEAIAIAVGLRTAARASVTGIEDASLRALVKLEQVLPARLRRRVGALGAVSTGPAISGPTVDPETLAALGAACGDRERVRFAYRDRTGTETRREVEPHALVNLGRRWYLLAWDRGREDWRTFRVDRISKPAGIAARFESRELPDEDAGAVVAGSISSATYGHEARVTLLAPADEVRDAFGASWGTIEPVDASSCEFRTSDDDMHWLAMRILMLGVDFEVHEPAELVAQLESLAARLGRAVGARPR
jgi:predicted DNA-binding transcriptional regulator YafY